MSQESEPSELQIHTERGRKGHQHARHLQERQVQLANFDDEPRGQCLPWHCR